MDKIVITFVAFYFISCNNNKHKVSEMEKIEINLLDTFIQNEEFKIDSLEKGSFDSKLNTNEIDFTIDAKMAGLKMKSKNDFSNMDASNCKKIYSKYLISLKNSSDTFFTNYNIGKAKNFIEALDLQKSILILETNVNLKVITHKTNMIELLMNKKYKNIESKK